MNKRRFLNALVEQKTATIYLYGEVGEGEKVDSLRVAQELAELEKQADKIDVRINSIGGDVFNGIAIFNALRNSKADISIYIDGVAASIAGVIALCGKPLYMAKYARLMIHCVSGGAYGNAGELRRTANTIEDIENDLAQIVAQRCKTTTEQVKQLYFDGADHWLNASECQTLGLIAGVYDLEPEQDPKQEINKNSTDIQIYNALNKRIGVEHKYKTEIEQAVKLGLISKELRTAFEALLKTDKPAFEEYINKQKQQLKKEVADEVDKAFMTKLRNREKVLFYNDLGNEVGLQRLKEILSDIPPFMRIDCYIENKPQPNWTLEDYKKFDPLFLLENPQFYEQLKQKYGEQHPSSLEYYRKNHPEMLEKNPDFYNELVNREFSKHK